MNYSQEYVRKLQAAVGQIDLHKVDQAIEWFRQARDQDRQIFVCGNGGSAATASHLAGDILKGASYRRDRRFRILSLTDQLPVLTAYANDVGYAEVFREPLRNLLRPDDVVLGISASGDSENVVCALEHANGQGGRTIALTGRDGGRLAKVAQLNVLVPVEHMGLIEDAHMIVCHLLAYRFIDEPAY